MGFVLPREHFFLLPPRPQFPNLGFGFTPFHAKQQSTHILSERRIAFHKQIGEPIGQRKHRRLGYPSYLLCSENNWFKALAPRRRRILTSPLHSGFHVNLLHVALLKMTVSCSYYDILGVGRNASSDEIKAGYKKQSIALHPDKNPNGAELMKLVNEAYNVLKDERERAEYDTELRNDHHNNNRENNRQDNSSMVRSLKRQLSKSERKRSILTEQVEALQDEIHETKEKLATSNSSAH